METLGINQGLSTMRKTIFRKLTAREGAPFVWRIEAAQHPYSAKMVWSRSTPDSSLILDTGCKFQKPINLGSYDRRKKDYTVDLSAGDIVFLFPTEITLTTTGTATVLIALDCEFPDDYQQLTPVPRGELQIVTEEQFYELPVTPVDITDFAQKRAS